MILKISMETMEKELYIKKIQDYFLTERDEDLGIIAASEILDFFLEDLGVKIYNQAVLDSKLFVSRKMDDLSYDFDDLLK